MILTRPGDTHKALSKFSLHFLFGTVLSRLFGAVRDLTMAFCFGASASIAAFMVAYRFANLFRRLFGEGTASTFFAPHFEAVRSVDPKKGTLFFRDLFASALVILVLLSLGAMGALWGLKKTGALSKDFAQIIELTCLMVPGMLFVCLYALSGSLLNCERRFFLAAAAPTAFNILWIASALGLWISGAAQVGEGLGVAVSLAFLAQWLMLAPATWRFLRTHLSLREIFCPNIFSQELKEVIRPIGLSILGVSAVQINSLLDALFARAASLEGPAYLWYAIRIQQLPLALFGVAIMSALLPSLSRAVQGGDHSKAQNLLRFALTRSWMLIFPSSVALIVLGASGVNLLYGRGSFSDGDARGTILCLFAYAPGLIPQVFSLLLAPAFYARKEYGIPVKAALLSVGVNGALNALFVFGFKMGAQSVAWATSLAACTSLWVLAKGARARGYALFDQESVRMFAKVALYSLGAGALALAVGALLGGDVTLSLILGKSEPVMPRGFVLQVKSFGVVFATFTALLFICAKRMGLLPHNFKNRLKEVL